MYNPLKPSFKCFLLNLSVPSLNRMIYHCANTIEERLNFVFARERLSSVAFRQWDEWREYADNVNAEFIASPSSHLSKVTKKTSKFVSTILSIYPRSYYYLSIYWYCILLSLLFWSGDRSRARARRVERPEIRFSRSSCARPTIGSASLTIEQRVIECIYFVAKSHAHVLSFPPFSTQEFPTRSFGVSKHCL